MADVYDKLDEIIRSVPPGNGRDLVSRVARFVKRVHAGQLRADGDTVFEHVVGVAENVLDAGSDDPVLIAAALLHDVLEQTPLTLNDLEKSFGTRIARLVDALTMRPGDTTSDSVARAEAYGKDAVLLRVCDRIDAARRVRGRPPEKRDEYLDAIRNYHLVMARRHFPEFSAKLDYALREAGNRPAE
ncbi:MAG: HD domain-containing protein [Armatimonadota bacterium]